MKLFLFSDIHGSAYYLEQALARFAQEKADAMLLLGDALYHGARNPLPRGYDPKETAALLNAQAARITAVRGNCDSEVDQMVLNFPLSSDYSVAFCEGRRFFLTHGHLFCDSHMPPLCEGDVFLYGHTHVPRAERAGGVYFVNPGSVSLPKEGSAHSYGIYENGVFTLKDLEGNAYRTLSLI